MKILKIKPRENKANGQLNFALPKKELTPKVREMIKSGKIPTFKLRYEGFE
jgi:hypothetical protein